MITDLVILFQHGSHHRDISSGLTKSTTMRVKTTEVNYELCTEYTLNSRLELTNTKSTDTSLKELMLYRRSHTFTNRVPPNCDNWNTGDKPSNETMEGHNLPRHTGIAVK